MKKLLIIIGVYGVMLTSCRTTEANYRAAYEATKASQAAAQSDDGLDENTRRMLNLDKKQHQYVHIIGTDTLNITNVFAVMEQGSIPAVPQFSVVANAFSQLFNAQALLKRLQEAGFKDAYIFKTGTPDYYVAAGGSDNVADIPAIRRKLEKAGNPGSRAGFPAIVRVPRMK
ncbi:MAG: SPOR domain-containing protein [Bacteroides sp.]|nr:SPOR domain-containing protein [Bacteroides sp.]MCM1379773.1 SPOR domain-containing protein [Bacteroides sp.]MCM1445686.1 SPOR domain-containing protein [Prevotella sp.]